MTQAEMAKEVGISERTADRALRIERSDLPEEIKDLNKSCTVTLAQGTLKSYKKKLCQSMIGKTE